MTEDELQELESIEANEDDSKVICAENILLKNKRKARKILDGMTIEDKSLFMSYPIYDLL